MSWPFKQLVPLGPNGTSTAPERGQNVPVVSPEEETTYGRVVTDKQPSKGPQSIRRDDACADGSRYAAPGSCRGST